MKHVVFPGFDIDQAMRPLSPLSRSRTITCWERHKAARR